MTEASGSFAPPRGFRRHPARLNAWAFLLTLTLLTGHVHAQKSPAKPRRDPRGARIITDSGGDRRLEFGATAGGLLAGGERHTYLIHAPAGYYLKVAVTQQGIDVEAALLTASGELLVRVDNANGTRGAEAVSLVADADADFRVEIRPKEPKPQPAPYAISITEQRVSGEDDGKRVRAERLLASGETLRAEGTLDSYHRALAKYEEAYRLWRGLDTPGAATALLDMGKAHYFLLNMEEAVRKYEEALKLFEESRLALDEGVARLYIGMAKLALGDNAEALGYYGQALKLFTEAEDERYVSFALNETGRAYYLRGDANRALEYYGKALPIRHALNDRKGESFTLVSMGRAYSNGFGDDARALDLYQQALKIQRELNNRRLIAQTLGDIGRIHYKAGDHAGALGHYNDALRAAENGDPSVRAEILMYIGLVYAAWGRHREAVEQYFGEALRLQEGRDPAGRARTLQHMGRSYAALGDEVNALEHLDGALAVWQKVLHRTAEAETRYQIAAVESRRGRYAEACEHIRAALPVVETLRTSIANRALRAHYFASAQNYYELYIDALMRLSRQTNDKELEALALSVSESKRARALLDLLVEAKAEVRRTVSDPELLNREAAVQQELSAISLRQVTGEHVTPEQVRRIEWLLARLYDVDSEIRKKDPRYAALTRPSPPSLEQIQKGLLARDQMLLEYSLGDERSYLWAVTQTSAKSYVLRGRKEIEAAAERFMKSLTSRNTVVEGETEEARDARVGRADAEYKDAASSLGAMLGLDKATSETKAERLLVVADGELQYLPFSALLVPSRGEQRREGPPTRQPFEAWDKFAPLVAYYEIEEPPSMAVVAELRRERVGPTKSAPDKAIAVIADPVFSTADERCCKPPRGGAGKRGAPRRQPSGSPGPSLSLVGGNRTMAREAGITDGRGRIARLGFTRLEADEILALVPPSEQLKATGFEANLGLLTDGSKLSAYRILHLATHGLLNSEHPELSGILLSLVDERGRQQNGFLQLHQIYNLRLPAEMVVLSACETGVGRRMRGEGLNGISRGFMYAGARRVVASLWKVNDDSTSQLMKYFYQGLRLGENPDFKRTRPAAALRSAQLEMMRHRIWRHPYFWAAFVVQGEAD